jgi:hypothetical protein
MIWVKLIFGGFGRRGFQAILAALVLTIATAVLASSLMVVRGATDALAQAEQADRPDLVQIKGRFNRALFKTPRTGYLPPLTLPVYEPLIDPDELNSAVGGDGLVIPRQSFLRNVVSGDGFLNVYIYGIEPSLEPRVSNFSVDRGRFLQPDDGAVAVLDRASAQALGVDLGGSFPVRKADGEDLDLTVIGILGALNVRDPRRVPLKRRRSPLIRVLCQPASSSHCAQVRRSSTGRL